MGGGQSRPGTVPAPTTEKLAASPPKPAQPAWQPPEEPTKELNPQGGVHTPAPQPPSEDTRVDCLCKYNLLDSDHEERFDDITKLISEIFKVPIALVSIVDTDRQWFKSVVGLPVRQTPRDQSFCAWTLVAHVAQVLVVPDAENDARFRNNPLVTGEPDIRFYCGSPIITHTGHRMGSLCIIDRVRRNVSPLECIFLGNMADLVAREIEDPSGKQENATPLMMIDIEGNTVKYVNNNFVKATGLSKLDTVGKSFREFFKLATGDGDQEAVMAEVKDAVSKGIDEFSVSVKMVTGAGGFRLVFHSVCSQQLFTDSYIIGAPIQVAEVDSPVKEKLELSKLVFVKLEPLKDEAADSTAPAVFYPEASHGKVPNEVPVELGAPIGKGSYGTVYRGVWNGSTEVAVKVMPTETVVAEEGYNPTGEAVLTKKLSHPNLVTAYDHFEVASPINGEKEIWMLLELCEMGTLSAQLVNGFFRKKEGNWALDMKRVLKAAKELANAFAYIHSQDVIHSDLTTNNVLLVKDNSPEGFSCKVSDFGIAQILPADDDCITTEAHGTVTHMPPELLMDCKLSKATDVYSFGMVLWELYHAQRPFDGMLHAQVIAHVALKNMRPDIADDCPEAYRALIEECWDADDEERPTFEELKIRLGDIVA